MSREEYKIKIWLNCRNTDETILNQTKPLQESGVYYDEPECEGISALGVYLINELRVKEIWKVNSKWNCCHISHSSPTDYLIHRVTNDICSYGS